MPRLYGRDYDEETLRKFIGSMNQVGAVRVSRIEEGVASGVRTVDFRTGSGFHFTVLADRCLDISYGEYRGIPLCWRSPTGDVAPAFFEPEGLEWLRGFFGGILATCGLTTFGFPSEDAGEKLGLHGRIGYVPASNLWADAAWQDGEYVMWVQGKVREARVFGANLLLERRIWTRLGEKRLFIDDRITNEGYKTEPHMILYHFNIGYPVLSPQSRFLAPSRRRKPMNDWSEKGVDAWNQIEEPIRGIEERVFFHDMTADAQGNVCTAIVNPTIPIGAYVRYRKDQLDHFIQWKMLGENHYVMGMEPANADVSGRAAARASGVLKFLAPGQSQEYNLEFGVLDSAEEIAETERIIDGMRGKGE